jgi:drug/metabolite transporter (DMT)-like permease
MTPDGPALRRQATLWLLLVTVLWGLTFLWAKEAVLGAEQVSRAAGRPPDELLRAASAAFVGLRFGSAWLVVALLGRWAPMRFLVGRPSPGLWAASAVFGGSIWLGFALQTVALGGRGPAGTPIQTSLYVVQTALLAALLARRWPRPATLFGVALATVGAGYIDGPPQLSFGLDAWLTVAAALAFAVSILATDRYTRVHEPMAFTHRAYALVTVLSALWLVGEGWLGGASIWSGLLELVQRSDFLVPLAGCSLLGTVLAIGLINTFQRVLDPVRAAILYALEPIWTAVWVWGLWGEAPGPWLLAGGGALLFGNLVAELAPRRAAT